MTTLDDKLLGEKTQNYCSSSSSSGGEDNDDDEEGSSNEKKSPSSLTSSKIDINSTSRWNGYSQNTGPKGVIRDWQLYNEHQKAQWEVQQAKLSEELKKTAITCKSYGDQLKEQKEVVGDDDEIDELLDDEVLQGFVKKRLEKLTEMSNVKAKYPGVLKELVSSDEFLAVIEDSDKRVPVIIHVCDSSNICSALNACLSTLAESHVHVQFCYAHAEVLRVSSLFRSKGVPALLVYKGGDMVGNFVQLREEFGNGEVYHGDVENFLVEHGVLSDTK